MSFERTGDEERWETELASGSSNPFESLSDAELDARIAAVRASIEADGEPLPDDIPPEVRDEVLTHLGVLQEELIVHDTDDLGADLDRFAGGQTIEDIVEKNLGELPPPGDN